MNSKCILAAAVIVLCALSGSILPLGAQVITHNDRHYERIDGKWYFTKSGIKERIFLNKIMVSYPGADRLNLNSVQEIGGAGIIGIKGW